MPIPQYSTTTADNDDAATGVNWAEGQLPSTINNSARQMMTDMAYWRNSMSGRLVSGGAADVQTLTTNLSLSAYSDMMLLVFEAGYTNTGAMTMNVDGIGAKSVKLQDGNTDPLAGAVVAGGIYAISYEADADVVILLNPTIVGGTLSGYLTVQGAFTSLGIDDDATGERLQLSDGGVAWGDQGTAEAWVQSLQTTTDGSHIISGGTAATNGGAIWLYGASHATSADDIIVTSNNTNVLQYDASDTQWEVKKALLAEEAVTVQGAFTSLGIDDNATGEMLQLADSGLISWGDASSGESVVHALRTTADGVHIFTGGTGSSTGGAIWVYGPSHANANDIIVTSNSTNVLQYDASDTQWEVKTALLAEGAVTVQGAFTSVGIDDNATKEVLQIADTVLTVGDGTNDQFIYVDGAAAKSRLIRFRTGTSTRWQIGAQNTAESGANAGSNFGIYAYDDSGTFLGTYLDITRSDGNFKPYGKVDLTASTAGQIAFPATQNASTNANTLDDYEEGTWTPGIDFQTVGDLSVAYSTQVGKYTKIGREVIAVFNIVTSSFTHTTASGSLGITGFPFTPAATYRNVTGGHWAGITNATYSQWSVAAQPSASTLRYVGSGSASANAFLGASSVPTGGTVELFATVVTSV